MKERKGKKTLLTIYLSGSFLLRNKHVAVISPPPANVQTRNRAIIGVYLKVAWVFFFWVEWGGMCHLHRKEGALNFLFGGGTEVMH